MATTNFTSGTIIASAWLNDVDATIYHGKDNSGIHVVNVKDPTYGAVGDGITDDYGAFAAAWAAIKSTGGIIYIPPGTYSLATQWLLDVDLTAPYNYKIIGYGAEFTSTAAVTGHVIKVYKSFNNFGVTIEGLHFNHRGNTNVGGCIQAIGTNNLRIINCSVEHHNTKAAYTGIELYSHTPGDVDANSFWTEIAGFRTRMRSGGDGTNAACAIKLRGTANATHIRTCSFTNVNDAIVLETDGVAAGMPNAVRIVENNFEGVVNCVTINGAAPATAMPTGLKLYLNRVESATTFINITGPALTETGYPLSASDNYLTVGSVTNYIVNPNNQYYFAHEPSYFGVGAVNRVGGPSNYQIIVDGTGNHLIVSDLAGNSNYNAGHLILGSYHLWVESATGKLRINSSAPTSDSDGVVVGTQT